MVVKNEKASVPDDVTRVPNNVCGF